VKLLVKFAAMTLALTIMTATAHAAGSKPLTEEDVVRIVKRVLAEKEMQDGVKSRAADQRKDSEVVELVNKIVAVKEKEDQEKAKKEKENAVSVGGYMQAIYSDAQGTPDGTGGNFNISRSRLIIKKKLNDKTSFFSQYNANTTNAEGAQASVVDMMVEHKFNDELSGWLGQFVIANGFQMSLVSPKDIHMINVGQMYHNSWHDMNALWDTRDIGARLNFKPKGGKVDYALGVVNGAGILNGNARPDAKTIVGRIGYEPDKYWKLGIYGLSGKRYKAASAANAVYGTYASATAAGDRDRKRAGFDFRFKKDRLVLEGDYQSMETGMPGRVSDLKGKAFFVEAGYYVRPKFELTLKNDVLKADDTAANSKTTINAGGFNWYFDKKTKFQLVISNIKETPEIKNDRVDSLVTVEF